MGSQRTSNKDILDAISAQTAAIGNLVTALSGSAAPSEPDAPVTPAPVKAESGYDIPKPYMEHMDKKVAKLTATDGQARVLYLRKNQAGEHKLAYALKTRWDAGIKDNGMIGAVRVYK